MHFSTLHARVALYFREREGKKQFNQAIFDNDLHD